jgi:salicylate hydroxylase
MMGDAAHAMTPWQGSGAGQSIEDAMILDVLIKEVKEPHQLGRAFKVYDEVRRPRSQRVVASSKITGLISCGSQPDVGFDPDKIRNTLAPRWDFIKCLDVKDHKRAALSAFSARS